MNNKNEICLRRFFHGTAVSMVKNISYFVFSILNQRCGYLVKVWSKISIFISGTGRSDRNRHRFSQRQ